MSCGSCDAEYFHAWRCPSLQVRLALGSIPMGLLAGATLGWTIGLVLGAALALVAAALNVTGRLTR